MTDTTTRRALRVREFAEAYGITVGTVRRLVHTGEIAHFWLGGQMRIPVSELDRLANSATTSASEA